MDSYALATKGDLQGSSGTLCLSIVSSFYDADSCSSFRDVRSSLCRYVS
jgi:hypothetical protein